MRVGIEALGNELFVLLHEFLQLNRAVLELLRNSAILFQIVGGSGGRRIELILGRRYCLIGETAEHDVNVELDLFASQLTVSRLKVGVGVVGNRIVAQAARRRIVNILDAH